ncbi:MAG: hypothetical protein RRZ83_02650 [Alistipes sp.]
MTKSNKYLIWAVVIFIALATAICFASEIQVWFMSKVTDLLILVVVFAAGWLLGRFGTRRRTRNEENARNITNAQN